MNGSKYPIIEEDGLKLTKLEYFSIHCLKGLLSKDVGNYTAEEKVFVAIGCAKELLKQLEDEN
jgi:hypothetical protein